MTRRIERILRNLVNNAIEHGLSNPVDVILEGDDTAVSIVVRDHGMGMTEEQLEHVFDRFWRADPARTRTTGGSGLGLAIAVKVRRFGSRCPGYPAPSCQGHRRWGCRPNTIGRNVLPPAM